MLIWKWLSEILKRWDLVLVLSLHHPPQNLTAPSCPTGQYHQVGNGFTQKISQGNIYKKVLHKHILTGQYHSTQYVHRVSQGNINKYCGENNNKIFFHGNWYQLSITLKIYFTGQYHQVRIYKNFSLTGQYHQVSSKQNSS